MQAALDTVRAQFGRVYMPWIAGRRRELTATFDSRNPSHPDETVGRHGKGAAADAHDAVEAAFAAFPSWARTRPEVRVEMLFRCVEILKRRKYEFNAWLVFEAGKSWAEAEADTSEAIDFCDYYARLMLNSPRYRPVLERARDAGSFASGLQRAGYATDPNYADKLTRVINTTLRWQRLS